MVSIDDRVRLEASVASSMTSSGTTVVVTPSPHNLLGATHHTSLLATSSAHHLHSHHGHHLTGGQQQQQQQPMDEGQPGTPIDEPQDLTPTQVSESEPFRNVLVRTRFPESGKAEEDSWVKVTFAEIKFNKKHYVPRRSLNMFFTKRIIEQNE